GGAGAGGAAAAGRDLRVRRAADRRVARRVRYPPPAHGGSAREGRSLVIRRALLAAVLALLAVPAAASAHATLLGTVPARGAQLEQAPPQVELRFDEAVEAAFGSLKVFDGNGTPVHTGAATSRGTRVAVKLPPDLKDGTYTATYRVISADGHPVSGGFVFSIGEAGPAAKSVD